LVLVNSRNPRPGEIDGVDYYFRTRAQVEALRADHRYAVLEVRTDLQVLDVGEHPKSELGPLSLALSRPSQAG